MIFSIIYFILLAFMTNVNATGHTGIVGMGRTIFEPLCCYACLSAFWGLNLYCNENPGTYHATGNAPSCHAKNQPYLSSLAYCMLVKCEAANVGHNEVERCWSNVAGDGLEVSSMGDSLPRTAPSAELAYNAISLNETSLVNAQYYQDTIATIQAYRSQEAVHALYGFVPNSLLQRF
jgi:hypothetical protein